jgi:L-iditol 2-dehydrogenase/galactitol-1-phosphate 5-dehydrogenase
MVEPCAVALHAVSRMQVRRGSTAAVIGGGAVGNMAAQWLRELGCDPVIVTDVDARKLEIARSMGLIPVDAVSGDAVSEIYELTNGRGADCAVEACGLPETFLQAIQAAGRFGQVVFMGNIRGSFAIGEKDFSSILRRELVIYGTWNSRVVPREENDWTKALDAMDTRIRLSPLISHTPSLKEGPDTFRRMIRGEEYFNKVIFRL